MIKRENVIRVYSGKSGCMCGCNGTYSKPKNSDFCREDTKVSETHVSRVLNFLTDNFARVRYQKISDTESCAFIDERNGGRNYVVYYREAAAATMPTLLPYGIIGHVVLPIPKEIRV